MTINGFKLSAITGAVLLACQANAALYQVVEVDSGISANEAYGSAIDSSNKINLVTASDDAKLGCFASSYDCAKGDSFALAGDTRNGTDGISYRDEVPYRMDVKFRYVYQDDLESYCENELGYSTCEFWADRQWSGVNGAGGLGREREAFSQASYSSNAKGFIDSGEVIPPLDYANAPSSGSRVTDTENVVINKLDGSAPIGITSSGYYDNGNYQLGFRQRGFYGDVQLLPKQDADAEILVKQMGRTFAYDSFEYNGAKYVVGSAAIAPFDLDDKDKRYNGSLSDCDTVSEPSSVAGCQNVGFATQAYLWPVTDGSAGLAISPWSGQSTTESNREDAAAQGSIRAAAVSEDLTSSYAGVPVLGGFNTYRYSDNLLLQAAVFYPKDQATLDLTTENQWTSIFVDGAEVRQGGNYVYSNSLITAMNDNLIAIGEAKRYGSRPERGAANNRLFYVSNIESGTPSASYLSGGIFFTGAGGNANDINNLNEMVGAIDAEDNREINGKQRRRRAFINPLNISVDGVVNPRRAEVFANQAWILDNLTNGGSYSVANNQYRVIDATGINDDGVISATALKCDGGYDSTDHNSWCGDGNQDEKIVAVKLVPIAGATSADISKRVEGYATVERQGSSLGWLSLSLLALFGWCRRKF